MKNYHLSQNTHSYFSILEDGLKCDKSFRMEAVKQNGQAIKYILNPDLDIQLEVVKQNGFAIRFILNPDLNIQLKAVKQEYRALDFIDNPGKDIRIIATIYHPICAIGFLF